MPVVLVHGNPETSAVWDLVRPLLGRTDVIAPDLPGFGRPTPDGFGATRDDYVAWLVGELEAIGEPVDLVGHDWGGGFVARVACTRPDLLRSWASDILGCFDPEYVWHDAAQVWQAPGAGEEAVAAWAALPRADVAAMLAGIGVTPAQADAFATALDDEMGRCILSLYRSAAQPAMAEWGRDASAAAARPGLAVIATEDHYTGGPALHHRAAAAFGARPVVLDGLGHWWMLQDPARGAGVLRDFWASVG